MLYNVVINITGQPKIGRADHRGQHFLDFFFVRLQIKLFTVHKFNLSEVSKINYYLSYLERFLQSWTSVSGEQLSASLLAGKTVCKIVSHQYC